MDKKEYMARCGVTAHSTFFIYEHHHVFAHSTDYAINFNFGGSHVTLLCESEAHKQAVLAKFISDLYNTLEETKETTNGNHDRTY